MSAAALILAGLALTVSVSALRAARWSGRESNYWFGVAAMTSLYPSQERRYAELLEWTRAHRPSPLKRALDRWQPPPVRREVSRGR